MASPSARSARRPSDDGHGPARREEVLEQALFLMAERGIAGASLRQLAKRLGMSQPSLYHYFESKEDLVAQIVDYCTNQMLQVAPPPEQPLSKVEQLPRFVAAAVRAMWATERHPHFVRFLFVAAAESPQHRAVIQRAFEERLYPSFSVAAAVFAQDEAENRELQGIVWMIVYSLALAFMERRSLFDSPIDDPALSERVDWIVGAGETLLEQRVLHRRRR